jgi:parallel beta-helix repeat protein
MTRQLIPRFRLAAAFAVSLAMVAASAATLPVVLAASGSLYANSAAANCSDAGTGSSTQPYCSIIKAAQVASAGTTVFVTGGTYTGSAINPGTSGIAGSPITFAASPGVTISGGANAFAISGRSYIVIDGFTIASTSDWAISVSSSSNITISNNTMSGAGHAVNGQTAGGVRLSGTTASLITHNRSDNNSDHGFMISSGSTNNMVSFNEASLNAEGWQRNANGIDVIDTGSTGNTLLGNVVHDNEDSGLQFYPGANNGLAINNVSYNNGDHGIDDLNVTGGRLIGNTIYHNCTSGINVEGTSGNYTIMNNVSVDNAVYPAYKGIICGRRTGNIGIYDSAPASTMVDYNLVNLTTSGNMYVWNNNSYSSPTALFNTTGQEQHGILADPKWVSTTTPDFHLLGGSPAIDSANSGASGESSVDADNNPRVDDPATPNRGVGPRAYDDRGAYELQTGSTDTQAPSVPAGLTATGVTSSTVTLAWSPATDNVGVTGYTIYRGGASVGTSSTTGFTDSGLAASTTYTYAVDAFDSAGNHSGRSAAITATTSVRPVAFVQGASRSSGSRHTTTTFTLTQPVAAGDLLTGLFAQFDAAGQVTVSDNKNGSWTRAAGMTYTTGRGDIALFYRASSTAAPSGLTITIAATASTLLYGSAAEYAGIATTAPLDQVTLTSGTGFSVDSGPTGPVATGELVFGTLTSNNSLGTITSGSSQGKTFTMRSTSSNIAEADIMSGNAGAQDARFTITRSLTWYAAAAVFKPASAPADTTPPSIPSGLTASSGSSSVALGWNASSDNVGVAGYTVYRNGAALATVGASTLSYTDIAVSSVTQYTYAIDAFDAAGNHSAQSVSVSLTTPDWTPPTSPTGLTATNGASSVGLSWSASTDNVGVSGYTVYRNGASLATVGGAVLNYTDASVSSATAYTYRIDAFDGAGNHSAQSSAVSTTTLDWVPPSTPTGLTATASSTSVGLAWNADGDNVAVTGYTVYRNGSTLGTVGGSVLSYPDGTVSPSNTYTYTVDAFDAAGNHSGQSQPVTVTTPAQADTTPPSVPAGLAATAGPAGEVDLSWTASTDDVAVTGYTVFRDGSSIGTVSGSATTYADTAVSSATTYMYTVDAYDAARNHSAQSTGASITTPDWAPPTAPTGLAASAVTSSEIDLSWQAATDNVGVAGYTVYRGGSAVATLGPGVLIYADTGLGHGVTYSYTVTAFDAAGNTSPQSSPASATTPDDIAPTTPGGLAATATSSTSVGVSWTASSDNVAVTGYDVYRDGALLATVGAGTLAYMDTVAVGSTHSYTVDAFDAAGNHSATPGPVTVTTPTSDTTPPTTPTDLTATAPNWTQVNLSWAAATDNVGVAGYTVYRNGVALTTVGGGILSYTDGAVTPATNYSYSVDAFDAAGNHSTASTAAAVHVPAQIKFVQGKAVTSGARVTSLTISFGAVAQGDLLVGWFGEYDSAGQVGVSDNVNGAWTRSPASTTWNGATGDIALYYRANSSAAASLTITVSATNATYLQASPAEYSGVASTNPLDQVVVAKGSGTSADSGLTPATGAGELVYGGMVATNGGGTLASGASAGVPFTKRAQSTSGSQGLEDITSSAAGQQRAGFTFTNSVSWFMVCAVFKPA